MPTAGRTEEEAAWVEPPSLQTDVSMAGHTEEGATQVEPPPLQTNTSTVGVNRGRGNTGGAAVSAGGGGSRRGGIEGKAGAA